MPEQSGVSMDINDYQAIIPEKFCKEGNSVVSLPSQKTGKV